MLAQCQAQRGPSEMVATSFNIKIILSLISRMFVSLSVLGTSQQLGLLPMIVRPPSLSCRGGRHEGEASLSWGGGLCALTWLCLEDGFFSLALGPCPLLSSSAS